MSLNNSIHNILLTFIFLLLTQDYPSTHIVSANLLEQLERPMEKPAANKNDTVYTFMTLSHVSLQITKTFILQELDLYCNFLGNFSEFKQWTTAKLLFPETIDLQYCEYFRIFLLRNVGLQTTCEVSEYNNNNKKINEIDLKFKSEPIVYLYFLSSKINPTNSNFLIHYENSHEILILSNNHTNRNTILKQFQPKININYKWTFASMAYKENGSRTRIIRIENIFGFATSSDPIPHFLGYWSFQDGMQIDGKKLLGLDDFQGRLIRFTSLEGNPVVYLDRNTTTGELKGRGYLPDILESLSLFLNFKYVLLEPPDKSFGTPDDSGNWSGMVGMLLRNEADVVLMSLSLTGPRKQIMDFSPPVEYSATRLLIRKDFEVTEIKWESFVSPFHWKVWIAIPLTVILGVLTLMVLTQFDLLETTPTTSICLLFCCFLQQGMEGHSYFRRFPTRIVLGSFWVLAVVIYASYTARLTSFLAATTDTLPFKTLFDAVQNPNWKIGLVKGSAFWDKVKESPEPEMNMLTKRIEEDSSTFVNDFRGGVERVYKEKYIFFTSDLVPSFMVKGNCSYAWIPGNYFPGFGCMGYQKNLPFSSAISHRVSQLRETGQMRRLFRKWWGDKATCSAGGDAFNGMSLYETGTAFMIIIVGLSLAIFFFTGEILFRPKSKFQDSKKKIQRSISFSFETNFDTSNIPTNFPNLNTHLHLSNSALGEVLKPNPDVPSLTFGKIEYSENIPSTKNVDTPNHMKFFSGGRNLSSKTSVID